VNGLYVIRLGLARGGIEVRQAFTYLPDMFRYFFLPLVQILVVFLLRRIHVSGTTYSVGLLALPGLVGMSFVFSGAFGVMTLISVDREDGTLMRAKATPGGMTAYAIGRTVMSSAETLFGVVITVVVGVVAFPGVRLSVPGGLTLGWVAVLGLLATIPIGIVLGSLLPNPRYFPLLVLPFAGIELLSGVFYPITHLPGWVQAIGQVFPMYWLGLGMRAALLPSHLASFEIDGSWRLPYVFLVLALWSVLGLAAAPPLLRRMARRESGTRVAERRERARMRRT
jgi:ABC-2 type transport system permease protein